MVYTSIEASERLKKKNISCEIVNCRFIKPMDTSVLESIKNRFHKIITIEEGVITGGFGDGVASWLLDKGFNGTLKRLGLPDQFVEHGPRDKILSTLSLDVQGIESSIIALITDKKGK
jgi:1-deoxy-D-xylulose-5-phosphate synthase